MIQPWDDCRTTWQHVGGCLALASSLQVIDFGQCPAKVVLVTAEKLLNLRSVTAEIILDPSNDVIRFVKKLFYSVTINKTFSAL